MGRLAPKKGLPTSQVPGATVPGLPQFILGNRGGWPITPAASGSSLRSRDLGPYRFLGASGRCPTGLGRTRCFCSSVLVGSIAFCVLEAMAAGLPAVGTTVAGVPEAIWPGETGLLVPPGDHRQFAHALKTLLDSPELRVEFGRAARERVVKHFNIDHATQQIFQAYRDLLTTKYVK